MPEQPAALLRRCSRRRFESAEQEWRQLLLLLRLPLAAYDPVRIVLRQGGWKNASDPIPYVRRAAWREARRLDLVVRAGDPLLAVPPGIGHDAYIDWMSNERDDEPDDDDLVLQVDRGLHAAEEDVLVVDWDEAARRAGLDEAELRLLKCRALGIGRAELSPDLQAAWGRLRRKLHGLRRVLRTGKSDPGPPAK